MEPCEMSHNYECNLDKAYLNTYIWVFSIPFWYHIGALKVRVCNKIKKYFRDLVIVTLPTQVTNYLSSVTNLQYLYLTISQNLQISDPTQFF